MGAFIDIAGQVFGRLTVLARAENHVAPNGKPVVYWHCRCVCGNMRDVPGMHLRNGHTQSCGCYNNDIISTHRRTKDRTYRSWDAMKQRCDNPKAPDYRHYGGRGITICDRWRFSFENFVADMGDRPDGTSIERLDVNGDYEPSNCMWATPRQQTSNRRDRRTETMAGRTQSVMEWCREYGLDRLATMRVYARLDIGWPLEKALQPGKIIG